MFFVPQSIDSTRLSILATKKKDCSQLFTQGMYANLHNFCLIYLPSSLNVFLYPIDMYPNIDNAYSISV